MSCDLYGAEFQAGHCHLAPAPGCARLRLPERLLPDAVDPGAGAAGSAAAPRAATDRGGAQRGGHCDGVEGGDEAAEMDGKGWTARWFPSRPRNPPVIIHFRRIY